MLVGGVAVGLVLTTGAVAIAAGGLAPPAANPATIYRPDATPGRVILTPTETPATSQNVSWRTSSDVTTPKVELSLATKGDAQATKTFAATTTTMTADLGYQESHHSASMTGLAPDTTYVYRVGDGDSWSEWTEFSTAASDTEPFSFIMQGDAQNDIKSYVSRTFRAATEARPYAKVVMHAGDLIDTDSSDAEWGEWFGAAGFANGSMNVVAAAGNHEYYPGPQLSANWAAQFEYPQNGPDSTPSIKQKYAENVYFTDYQGVRFIALNSNFPGDTEAMAAQTDWLEDVLKNNPNKWTVVTFHHPIFSVTSGRDNAILRAAWMPLFEKYDVDIVLNGHDHAYGRGNVIANEADLPSGTTAAKSNRGPVYLVSVAGPKYYVPDPAESNNWIVNGARLRAMERDTQMYQLVDVKDGELHVESWNVSGQLVDGFDIVKSGGKKLVTTIDKPRAGGPGSSRAKDGTPTALPSMAVPGPAPTTTVPTTPEPTEPTATPPVTNPTAVIPALTADRSASQRYGSTARVTVTAAVPVVGGKRPDGSVAFKDGSRLLDHDHRADEWKGRLQLPSTLTAGRHQITATFTPAKGSTGHKAGTSTARTITVVKASSTTKISGLASKIKAKSRPTVTVRVAISGVKAPAARVRVYDGSKVIATVTLKASANGTVKVKLPRLKKGSHKISVRYDGTGNVVGSSPPPRR
ncbi:fibronectin type III domain-containing protein [Aeromicrobium sp. UC242_57]|uniref:fibronectin type III domain-containing protein n=1 Tax=Aeromicrobium sp. UC242_57 TaxID=3374624 RepID=UPI0037BAA89A